MEKMSDALFRTAVKTGIIARTYRTAAGSVAAMAIFFALSLSNENQVIDIMSLHVFGGIIVGACSAFVLTGMLIGSVLTVVFAVLKIADAFRNMDNVPQKKLDILDQM